MQLPDLSQVAVMLPLQSLLATNILTQAEIRPANPAEIKPEVLRNSLLGKSSTLNLEHLDNHVIIIHKISGNFIFSLLFSVLSL